VILLTADELRAVVAEAVEPLRRELVALRRERDDQAVTIAEAARRLGVSARTIQRQVASGALPSIRVGRAVRIPAEAMLGNAQGAT
jgi:excisionase family DNA binding protein